MDEVSPVLRVGISVADADPQAAARSVLRLQAELRELDMEAVDRVALEPAPAGAKGVADGTGALIVSLSDSALLVALVGVLRSWISRDRDRKVTIRIGEDSVEVARASEQQQAQLIQAWLDRHARH